MIYGPCGRQLELLKGDEKHQTGLNIIRAMHSGVIFGEPLISRMQHTLEKQMRAPVCVLCVLDGHVGGILHWARLKG